MNVAKPKSSRLAVIGRDFQRNKMVYLMLLPVIVFYLVFAYGPMFGVVTAFQNYKPALGVMRSKWVGLENIIDYMTGRYAWRTIRNTLLINIYQIIFSFPMPIIFALLLNELKAKKFKKLVQTISYMPHFISIVVVCGMIRLFTRSDGVINAIAGLFGANFGNLLAQASTFRPVYIVSGIWQGVGWGSIIYLATLSGVDPTLHEAAAIDGAGRLRRVWHITMPALVPVIVVQLIMTLGSIMNLGYEKIILLYNENTYETADVISTYVYRYGLEGGKYGMGAAIGLFNSLVNILILTGSNWLSRRMTEESLW